MGTNRLVFASFDFDTCGPEVTREYTDASESLSMQC